MDIVGCLKRSCFGYFGGLVWELELKTFFLNALIRKRKGIKKKHVQWRKGIKKMRDKARIR